MRVDVFAQEMGILRDQVRSLEHIYLEHCVHVRVLCVWLIFLSFKLHAENS